MDRATHEAAADVQVRPKSVSFRAIALERLELTERNGLRLALLLRTGAVGAALLWYVVVWLTFGFQVRWGAIALLTAYTAIGIAHLTIIGTKYDRWWLKFVVVAVDAVGICTAYVLIPVSTFDDVPQILSIRIWGVYFLFPIIALATLSLSWQLVVWAGFMCSAGWMSLFFYLRSLIENPITWNDLARETTAEDYQQIFLSMDFTGTGTRVIETGSLSIAAIILATTVYRARQVFLAQIRAETERAREKSRRQVAVDMLGRFVPASIASRLLEGDQSLEPEERETTILVLDIAEFSSFAAVSSPRTIIERLDDSLSACAEVVAAHNGVVISYTGDGLLASFNNPVPVQDPRNAAVKSAIEMPQRLAEHGFSCRIGLAHGLVVAGRIGSAAREAFTVYGETVNIAARLEAHCKVSGHVIVMDGAVCEALDQTRHMIEPLGALSLRGIGYKVGAYGIKAQPPV